MTVVDELRALQFRMPKVGDQIWPWEPVLTLTQSLPEIIAVVEAAEASHRGVQWHLNLNSSLDALERKLNQEATP